MNSADLIPADSSADSNFCYTRRVAYCDTDAMGVVHHSNYLRYFEEARVAWLRVKGLTEFHAPQFDMTLAVVQTGCRHWAPARFDDLLCVKSEVKRERLKIRFQYAIFLGSSADQESRPHVLVANGFSEHVPMNSQLKVCRLPKPLIEQLEKEPWTETWPSNL